MEGNASIFRTTENKFQDCVFITPALEYVSGKVKAFFSVVFGEHREPKTPIGEIRFGIRRGELRLEIINGYVTPGDLDFIQDFAVVTEIDAVDEGSDSSSNTAKIISSITGKQGLEPSIGAGVETSAELTLQEGTKRSRSFKKRVYHVKANWHSTSPRWVFYNQLWDTCLEGIIKKRLFAVITMIVPNLNIRYWFDIKPNDIVFTEAPFVSNASSINKKRILHALLIKILLGNQRTLSQGDIQYE